MKILVLVLLAATSIHAFAQSCPAVDKEVGSVQHARALGIDRVARMAEKGLIGAIAQCAKSAGREVDLEAELTRIGMPMTASEIAAAQNSIDPPTAAEERVSAQAATEAAAKARYKLYWESDPGNLASVGREISYSTTLAMISAKGAVQVTQLASQLQIEYSQLLMRQNDEIIRLLRVIAKEKK